MLKELGRHLWRVKTLVLIFALSWWATKRGFPVLGMLPPASGEEPERWYILFAVLYKMSGALILFHVVRHELFPYIRLGQPVEDYSQAVRAGKADLAQAAAIQTLAYCLLIGFLLFTIVPVIAKW
jgi:hypothetical protein